MSMGGREFTGVNMLEQDAAARRKTGLQLGSLLELVQAAEDNSETLKMAGMVASGIARQLDREDMPELGPERWRMESSIEHVASELGLLDIVRRLHNRNSTKRDGAEVFALPYGHDQFWRDQERTQLRIATNLSVLAVVTETPWVFNNDERFAAEPGQAPKTVLANWQIVRPRTITVQPVIIARG